MTVTATAATYDQRYFAFITEASIQSARILLPVVARAVSPRSVVDFGCGTGAWLKVWKELGVRDVTGVDGEYVGAYPLLIEPQEFVCADLERPVDLGRQFDLVQCLEVGEHLDWRVSEGLVETLVRHGNLVLFSAAVPGQGGYRHVNEQPYEYWRALFARHGYSMLDAVRPSVVKVPGIEPWYALNSFVFAAEAALSTLTPVVASSRVPIQGLIRDYSSIGFKLRKALIRRLPRHTVDTLHRVKKTLFLLSHRPGSF
jgi:SAM-dependent methyltransferase